LYAITIDNDEWSYDDIKNKIDELGFNNVVLLDNHKIKIMDTPAAHGI